jgi:hypothetical protein
MYSRSSINKNSSDFDLIFIKLEVWDETHGVVRFTLQITLLELSMKPLEVG